VSQNSTQNTSRCTRRETGGKRFRAKANVGRNIYDPRLAVDANDFIDLRVPIAERDFKPTVNSTFASVGVVTICTAVCAFLPTDGNVPLNGGNIKLSLECLPLVSHTTSTDSICWLAFAFQLPIV